MKATAAAALITPDQHKCNFAYNPVIDRLWSVPWTDIRNMEIVPGCPFLSDKWVISTEWASGGSLQGRSYRTIDFLRVLPKGWQRSEDRSEVAVRRLKRIAALMFITTLRLRRRVVRPPKPSTWVMNSQALIRACQSALALPHVVKVTSPSTCPDGVSIFQDLSPEQIEALKAEHPTFASAVVARMNGLLEAGACDDWPARDVAVLRFEGQSWRPFNDLFTATAGHAAVWMMEDIGPDLLSCWGELREIQTTAKGGRRKSDVNERRKEWLSNWHGQTLTPGLNFKYQILCNVSDDDGSTVVVDSWPPRLPLFVRNMVSLLQAAHMIVLALATGARDGELVGLQRECLDKVQSQNLLTGQTYKLSDSAHGELRNWPLPKLAIQAIKQQARIAEILDPDGTRLFVSFSARSQGPLRTLSAALRSFIRRIRLLDGRPLEELCDGTVHLHRFRMTVARLTALSLVGANQILFDILGHRDPEMTLSYILADPRLQDDMRQIAREAALTLAKKAIETADLNGGPAAPRLRELADRLLPRSAELHMDVQALETAAEILSQNGRVMLVKPNVLCTKTFNQFGPCSSRVGAPDIGNCKSECLHRLEFAAARSDHRQAIEQVLAQIPTDEGMMRVWWQGQLLSHLMPFADLREEMLADLRVREALKGVAQDSIDMLDERYRAQITECL